MGENSTVKLALTPVDEGEGVTHVGFRVRNTQPDVRRRGFTLIELLVVIALITIIAGVVFPVLAQAREMARSTTCLSNLQQISRAHQMYLDDWDEQLPDWRLAATVRPETPYGHLYWMDYLQPYMHNRALFLDPSAAEPTPPPGEGIKLADYALMTWGPSGYGAIDFPYFRWPGPPFSRAQVQRPAETICLMDGYTATALSRGFAARHRKGVNAAFIDGHVRWLPFRELYRVDGTGDDFYFYHYCSVDR